ncbi:MAG: hypothetical protein GTO55_11605, partial [Armatimonadetes bacterium]|nr:hypothetical protein [Armatimonadota bacterium]NIM68751.1 hypothetical protein [Armatimonadota bacterium]NIM77012.1 hypothetical protein [Armatimonadota bacterium]NIN06948.1 hypothetical protein [Armatimonadota bacterium]NIT32255.1 hypothetical protein [Armatimonadota bacterium]
METAGYWVALLAVVVFPPVLLVWLVIHPFTHRWRRLPAAATYSVVIAILVLLMA